MLGIFDDAHCQKRGQAIPAALPVFGRSFESCNYAALRMPWRSSGPCALCRIPDERRLDSLKQFLVAPVLQDLEMPLRGNLMGFASLDASSLVGQSS